MIERISTPKKTKEIIEKYSFYFKKNFGQNFLIDSNIINNIISYANIKENDFVLEIGPGIGSLTQILSERAKKVLSVEIDNNLIPILKETLKEYNNIEIINNDILKLDLKKLIIEKNENKPIKVVANLPYYITTPIIMELLEQKLNIESITVMVQKEVAERMKAKPKTKDYGALSVAVQYYCDTKIDIIVPPSCFIPRPKVESAIITLKILDKPKIELKNEELFFNIVKSAFGQRRKTLINSIYNQCKINISKEEIKEIMTKSNISDKVRGEELSITELGKLSDNIYSYINKKDT